MLTCNADTVGLTIHPLLPHSHPTRIFCLVSFCQCAWNAQKAIPDPTYNPAIPDGDSHAISVGFGLFCQGSGHFFGIIPCGDSEKALRPKGIKLSCTKFGPSLKTLIRRSMECTGPRSMSVRSICA